MHFSTGCEYAVHSMFYLATRPKDEVVMVGDIARAQNIPESYLVKVFQQLSRAGLVNSYRGAKGGVSLAKEPSDITLKDIVEAVDGSNPLYVSLGFKRKCDAGALCLIRQTFDNAEKKLFEELSCVSLEDLKQEAEKARDKFTWLN
ncbi:Rrf2 family transcriptional regulator [bacterium]|nr:Rrf2 family transcriptional regulator [FCB group bacterium]MBL7190296.1 Rrf2 family transcriptional regulator [bacterium]